MDLDEAKSAVVKVGDGRGFVAHGGYVITAAHCLPFFPPCHGASHTEERTYKELLGPLGQQPEIWAECLFADPIGDIAVLGRPDNQALPEQFFAYEKWVYGVGFLPIADAPQNGPAWLLSLDAPWYQCTVQQIGNMLWLSNAAEEIRGGMSGSPIITDNGSAIGIVCISSSAGMGHNGGGPNPRLTHNLPGWLLRELS